MHIYNVNMLAWLIWFFEGLVLAPCLSRSLNISREIKTFSMPNTQAHSQSEPGGPSRRQRQLQCKSQKVVQARARTQLCECRCDCWLLLTAGLNWKLSYVVNALFLVFFFFAYNFLWFIVGYIQLVVGGQGQSWRKHNNSALIYIGTVQSKASTQTQLTQKAHARTNEAALFTLACLRTVVANSMRAFPLS